MLRGGQVSCCSCTAGAKPCCPALRAHSGCPGLLTPFPMRRCLFADPGHREPLPADHVHDFRVRHRICCQGGQGTRRWPFLSPPPIIQLTQRWRGGEGGGGGGGSGVPGGWRGSSCVPRGLGRWTGPASSPLRARLSADWPCVNMVLYGAVRAVPRPYHATPRHTRAARRRRSTTWKWIKSSRTRSTSSPLLAASTQTCALWSSPTSKPSSSSARSVSARPTPYTLARRHRPARAAAIKSALTAHPLCVCVCVYIALLRSRPRPCASP